MKYSTKGEMSHNEFMQLDLDRSSAKEKYPNEIHLGFRKIIGIWTQVRNLRNKMTLEWLLDDRFDNLMGFKRYPTDRSGKMTKNPRRANYLEMTSARSMGEWSQFWISLGL